MNSIWNVAATGTFFPPYDVQEQAGEDGIVIGDNAYSENWILYGMLIITKKNLKNERHLLLK